VSAFHATHTTYLSILSMQTTAKLKIQKYKKKMHGKCSNNQKSTIQRITILATAGERYNVTN
jgi:hypothetical protein